MTNGTSSIRTRWASRAGLLLALQVLSPGPDDQFVKRRVEVQLHIHSGRALSYTSDVTPSNPRGVPSLPAKARGWYLFQSALVGLRA